MFKAVKQTCVPLKHSMQQIHFLDDLHGNFFDRGGGGVIDGNPAQLKNLVGAAHFLAAGLQGGIRAVGAPFLANGVQALGIDMQAHHTLALVAQEGRQLLAVKIFAGQREIGGAHKKVHGQIQANRRFGTARYANHDDVGIII